MKNILINTTIFLFSIFIALLGTEFVVRLWVDPVNYLKPELESDPLLGHKIIAGSGGHDAWGFRNVNIPDKVDILAIGDSQTYGVMAPANESWPSKLAQLTNKEIYNLSLGGYGPVQYLHLLKTKEKKLNPDLVVIGIYPGNDFKDSYRLVYNNNNWSNFRSENIHHQQTKDTNAVDLQEQRNNIREWLAYNSVLYRMITSSFIGDIVRLWETKKATPQNSNDIFFINIESSGINTGFTPTRRLIGLDLDDIEVKEGIRISILALKQIKDYTDKNKIKLLVVIIPTKENVYSRLLQNTPEFSDNNIMNKLLSNEAEITNQLIKYFKENKIQYVLPLNSMQKAVVNEPVYPSGYDGHPNGKGYEIIAMVIKNNIVDNLLLENSYSR